MGLRLLFVALSHRQETDLPTLMVWLDASIRQTTSPVRGRLMFGGDTSRTSELRGDSAAPHSLLLSRSTRPGGSGGAWEEKAAAVSPSKILR